MRWKHAFLAAGGSESKGVSQWLPKSLVSLRPMEFALLFLLGYMCFSISLNQTSYLRHSRLARGRVVLPDSLWRLVFTNVTIYPSELSSADQTTSANQTNHVMPMDRTSASFPLALVGAKAAIKNYSLFEPQLLPAVNSSRRLNRAGKRSRVAIVIPYRNRKEQLATFTPRLTKFLSKQNLDFHFIVIEQLGRAKFNRGSLMNIGFLEAERLVRTELQDEVRPFDCIALHDVDMIPVHAGNLYDCLSKPYGGAATQLSTAIDMYGWKMPNKGMADGGVVLMPWAVYVKANGFNNRFFGWGGEDNDFASRLKATGNSMRKQKPAVGRYVALKEGHFRSPGLADNRWDILHVTNELMGEGLSTIKFRVVQRRESSRRVHTITVDTWPHEDPDVVKTSKAR